MDYQLETCWSGHWKSCKKVARDVIASESPLVDIVGAAHAVSGNSNRLLRARLRRSDRTEDRLQRRATALQHLW